MTGFVFENPPLMQTDDGRTLGEYLARQMNLVREEFDAIHDWEDAEPFDGKPQDAMLRFFNNGAPGNNQGPGYYFYYGTLWIYLGGVALDLRYAPKGYGGISKTTDTNYGTVGSGSWTTIDNWDSVMVLNSVGVTQDVANSGLRVTEQGVYKVTGTIGISFTDTNSGRVFGVRLWNDTKSTAGREVEYFVGRNQEGINISQGALLAEIGASEIGDLFQLQIAGVGDSFSNTAVIDALFSLTRHG